MRPQMYILHRIKLNNDLGRTGKEAAMSYLNTYQTSKTKTHLNQENQLQRQKMHLGPPTYKTEKVTANCVVCDQFTAFKLSIKIHSHPH